MTEKNLNIEQDLLEIVHDDLDLSENMFDCSQLDSLKFHSLYLYTKSLDKDLVLEAHGEIIFCKGKLFNDRNAEYKTYTSRIITNGCLVSATHDLSEDMRSQFEEEFGKLAYELRSYFTEGFELIEINKDSVVIRLCCGT